MNIKTALWVFLWLATFVNGSIIFLVLFVGMATPAYGHLGKIDYSLLRDIICAWETRGLSEVQKDDYIGKAGEVGRCAIRPGTARWAGYRGTNINLLRNGNINRIWAKEILIRVCARRVKSTAYALARCYNGGPKSKSTFAQRYAKIIAAKYAHTSFMRETQ